MTLKDDMIRIEKKQATFLHDYAINKVNKINKPIVVITVVAKRTLLGYVHKCSSALVSFNKCLSVMN